MRRPELRRDLLLLHGSTAGLWTAWVLWGGWGLLALASYSLLLTLWYDWVRWGLGIPYGGAVRTRSRVVLDLGLWHWRGRLLRGLEQHNTHASSWVWLICTHPADLGWRNLVPSYLAFGVRLPVLGAAGWGVALALAGHALWPLLQAPLLHHPLWLVVAGTIGIVGGLAQSFPDVELKWANGAPPTGPDQIGDEFTPVGKFADRIDEDEARQGGDERAELLGH